MNQALALLWHWRQLCSQGAALQEPPTLFNVAVHTMRGYINMLTSAAAAARAAVTFAPGAKCAVTVQRSHSRRVPSANTSCSAAPASPASR